MSRCSRVEVRKEPPLMSGFACEKTPMRDDPATSALRSPSPLETNQMMSRYQRLIPTDCIPLTNGGGKKPPTIRAFKEDDADRIPNCSFPSSFDAKPLRARPAPFGSTDRPAFPVPLSDHQPPIAASTSNGANILPGWGHKKRSRGSRADGRAAAAAEEPSSSPSRRVMKIQRRAAAAAEKLAAAMPPPSAAAYTRGANLRPCTPVRVATSALVNRSVEERSGSHPRSEKRSPTSRAEKGHKAVAELPNGKESKACPENDTPAGGGGGVPEKLNLRHFEWPRIYVSLSRKEKEDDFLVMKGTKLPQRPKKRAKNVDRTLQYCYPGMFLSDLTRGRYEVREKKCVKKKRRGLKGMESMDSDSD